jgi:hypothetical protein
MAEQNKKASLEKLDECEQIIIGILELLIRIHKEQLLFENVSFGDLQRLNYRSLTKLFIIK